MRHLFTLVAILGLLGVWLYTRSLVPGLPAQIPFHFDAAGHANRMAPASELYLLPKVATLLAAVFLAAGQLIVFMASRAPGLVNLPNKEAFLALDPAGRVRAVSPMAAAFSFVALLAEGMIAYLVRALSEVALGHAKALEPTPLLALLPLALVALVAGTMATSRAVRREAGAR